jgi:DNA gyrase subunit A
MITCKSGITIRMRVQDIREAGRATQGVRLINLEDGDEIAAIARIEEQEEQPEEMEGENAAGTDAGTEEPTTTPDA